MNQIIINVAATNKEDKSNGLIQITTPELKDYKNEGSEFLNDTLRMIEQPLNRTEESIAPGSPKGFF